MSAISVCKILWFKAYALKSLYLNMFVCFTLIKVDVDLFTHSSVLELVHHLYVCVCVCVRARVCVCLCVPLSSATTWGVRRNLTSGTDRQTNQTCEFVPL